MHSKIRLESGRGKIEIDYVPVLPFVSDRRHGFEAFWASLLVTSRLSTAGVASRFGKMSRKRRMPSKAGFLNFDVPNIGRYKGGPAMGSNRLLIQPAA
jgi:hypothetical protein